jgi:hypothetical protein
MMNHETGRTPAMDCARIKKLGYSTSHHIHMYGEHFEIVSDPFPDGAGVAVDAITARNPVKRRLHLPVAILVGARDIFPKTA